ncbi:hypothetical protein [Mycolicibacterium sp. YH-1]|uniref:hypothetical protein n=1 Tax=Mycolicibacterium sp. YH-1 TaxID=2908837 RepID=UPI001F4BF394|nr:hypothetical protein [Mycolicibacterium sp. YH-1]UNB54435.1 hypothetical protein L0M16_08985 [Mycolicibacterium sp. YH-1]
MALSVHQDRLYPSDSGSVDERGTADGNGTTINVPLPAGCGLGAYERAFDRVVLPALHRLRPEQEGGYSPLHVLFCGAAIVAALIQSEVSVADPYSYCADNPEQLLTRIRTPQSNAQGKSQALTRRGAQIRASVRRVMLLGGLRGVR